MLRRSRQKRKENVDLQLQATLRLVRRASVFQVIEIKIYEVPTCLQIEKAEAIEASPRGFMLLRNARCLRVTVEGDRDFAGLVASIWIIAKRPPMHPAVGLNRRPGVFEMTFTQTIVIAAPKIMAHLTRAFDEDSEEIGGPGLPI